MNLPNVLIAAFVCSWEEFYVEIFVRSATNVKGIEKLAFYVHKH